jgi:hypothetical protein
VMEGHPSPFVFIMEQTFHVCRFLTKHHKVILLMLRYILPLKVFSYSIALGSSVAALKLWDLP